MTPEEIATALEKLILDESKRPPAEQVRGLIEAGVIDKQGRVLIGFPRKLKVHPSNGQAKRPSRRGSKKSPR